MTDLLIALQNDVKDLYNQMPEAARSEYEADIDCIQTFTQEQLEEMILFFSELLTMMSLTK